MSLGAFPQIFKSQQLPPGFMNDDTDDDDGFLGGGSSRPNRRITLNAGDMGSLARLAGLGLDDPVSGGGVRSARNCGFQPSSQYISAARIRSQEEASDHPLVVISIEAVLCAKLPPHLSGGHTNVLSRMYVSPFIDYLLHPGNRWSIAFWTGSMKRKEALEVLRMLKYPTGSAEKDERDGVVGVWSKEDCKTDKGGQICVKDLQVIWDELYDEEGIRWSQEDTVVITDFPEYMSAQPKNFILAPAYHYKMATPAWDDQFLLMMIACLEELETQTNFSQYIGAKGQEWDQEDVWLGKSPDRARARDEMVHNAIRICAQKRIPVIGGGGN